jgi:hypothetical protein|tara:strand:+ start:383 stop:565 length:183 start_codon:yes stop_codon:yes gene_type:complete
MSEPTVIDAEYEETEITLEGRVSELEEQAAQLLQGQKNILEYLREMIEAVTEISEESSEE